MRFYFHISSTIGGHNHVWMLIFKYGQIGGMTLIYYYDYDNNDDGPTPHGYTACKCVCVIHKWFFHLSMFNGKAVWVLWPWGAAVWCVPKSPAVYWLGRQRSRVWIGFCFSRLKEQSAVSLLFIWSKFKVNRYDHFHVILSPLATSGMLKPQRSQRWPRKSETIAINSNCNLHPRQVGYLLDSLLLWFIRER